MSATFFIDRVRLLFTLLRSEQFSSKTRTFRKRFRVVCKKPVKHNLACYTLLRFIVHKFFTFSYVFLVCHTLLHFSYYALFHGFLQTTLSVLYRGRRAFVPNSIALLHDDVTIKTFIKNLLFNARDHGRSTGTKQRKFTESRSKTGKNSRREVE